MINIVSLNIPDVKILRPEKFEDHRGFFSETYHKRTLEKFGIDIDFLQDNQSYSVAAGTLRGLHFQTHPFAQAKLVRVLRGRVLDVAVDIRVGSPTYGQHVNAEISATNWNQILIPIGFAHGILTLEPDTEVLYKVSNYYAPECDRGLLWNDPRLAIVWNFPLEKIVISAKDRCHPSLDVLPGYFHYQA